MTNITANTIETFTARVRAACEAESTEEALYTPAHLIATLVECSGPRKSNFEEQLAAFCEVAHAEYYDSRSSKYGSVFQNEDGSFACVPGDNGLWIDSPNFLLELFETNDFDTYAAAFAEDAAIKAEAQEEIYQE